MEEYTNTTARLFVPYVLALRWLRFNDDEDDGDDDVDGDECDDIQVKHINVAHTMLTKERVLLNGMISHRTNEQCNINSGFYWLFLAWRAHTVLGAMCINGNFLSVHWDEGIYHFLTKSPWTCQLLTFGVGRSQSKTTSAIWTTAPNSNILVITNAPATP